MEVLESGERQMATSTDASEVGSHLQLHPSQHGREDRRRVLPHCMQRGLHEQPLCDAEITECGGKRCGVAKNYVEHHARAGELCAQLVDGLRHGHFLGTKGVLLRQGWGGMPQLHLVEAHCPCRDCCVTLSHLKPTGKRAKTF